MGTDRRLSMWAPGGMTRRAVPASAPWFLDSHAFLTGAEHHIIIIYLRLRVLGDSTPLSLGVIFSGPLCGAS